MNDTIRELTHLNEDEHPSFGKHICHYCKKPYDHKKGEGSFGGSMNWYGTDYICNSCYENGTTMSLTNLNPR